MSAKRWAPSVTTALPIVRHGKFEHPQLSARPPADWCVRASTPPRSALALFFSCGGSSLSYLFSSLYSYPSVALFFADILPFDCFSTPSDVSAQRRHLARRVSPRFLVQQYEKKQIKARVAGKVLEKFEVGDTISMQYRQSLRNPKEKCILIEVQMR
jgi:hypothetical protein